ncbi:TetR family transcriptional regulator [Nocardiopsis nanhaiensis]
MGTVSGHRRPREGTGVRERLMDAAYAEVLAGDWAERRMVDIAAAAQVSRQTLYNVFGSKEGLLQAVVVREVNALLDTVVRVLETDGHDPAHAVSRTTRMVLLAARDSPLLRAVVTGDDELLPVLTTRSAPLLDALRERISWTLGERCPDVDPAVTEVVADVTLRLIVSYSLQPIDADQAAHRVEMVVHGMLPVGRRGAGADG